MKKTVFTEKLPCEVRGRGSVVLRSRKRRKVQCDDEIIHQTTLSQTSHDIDANILLPLFPTQSNVDDDRTPPPITISEVEQHPGPTNSSTEASASETFSTLSKRKVPSNRKKYKLSVVKNSINNNFTKINLLTNGDVPLTINYTPTTANAATSSSTLKENLNFINPNNDETIPDDLVNIYHNKLWREQMPVDKKLETICEDEELGRRSRKREFRFIEFTDAPTKSKAMFRRRKAIRNGWKVLSKKTLLSLDEKLKTYIETNNL